MKKEKIPEGSLFSRILYLPQRALQRIIDILNAHKLQLQFLKTVNFMKRLTFIAQLTEKYSILVLNTILISFLCFFIDREQRSKVLKEALLLLLFLFFLAWNQVKKNVPGNKKCSVAQNGLFFTAMALCHLYGLFWPFMSFYGLL